MQLWLPVQCINHVAFSPTGALTGVALGVMDLKCHGIIHEQPKGTAQCQTCTAFVRLWNTVQFKTNSHKNNPCMMMIQSSHFITAGAAGAALRCAVAAAILVVFQLCDNARLVRHSCIPA